MGIVRVIGMMAEIGRGFEFVLMMMWWLAVLEERD